MRLRIIVINSAEVEDEYNAQELIYGFDFNDINWFIFAKKESKICSMN